MKGKRFAIALNTLSKLEHLWRSVAVVRVPSHLLKYFGIRDHIPLIKFSILEEQVNAEGIFKLSAAAKPLI
ncbi:hypothetical protein QUA54_00205 [Microcoleus sp. MOSTC5]|uniref:hypothetical protein n=1 Tax=Microcoleus sp. MOSTC5 TaxID=3055378 RepID=UPI002FD5C8F3